MATSARPHRTAVLWALGLSLFWILFGWGIFDRGPVAMGINYAVFTLGIAVFFSIHAGERAIRKHHLPWIIPILLILLSFVLFENPFIKAANVLVLPPLFALYRIAVSTPGYGSIPWNDAWMMRLAARVLRPFSRIGAAVEQIVKTVTPLEPHAIRTVRKVLLGLAIFVVLALAVFIPLLSAADPAFAAMVRSFVEVLEDILSVEWLLRILFFAALSVALTAMAAGWNAREEFRDEGRRKMIDDVVSGVVLGGILLLYLLFLWTQVRSLWVPALPAEFHVTELLVKSGFWQLFILSVINVLLFFVSYRRTHNTVQHVLTAFTVASLLLLFSAAKRMGMYAWYYGFSYEKFFASYTVLFAVVLFAYLLWCLFHRDRRDIVKFLAYAFVWMYAIAAVLPTEQFIFRANAWLFRRPDSRINMQELQMLSADVYGLVLRENGRSPQPYWDTWLTDQRRKSAEKRWYEWDVQDLKLRVMTGL